MGELAEAAVNLDGPRMPAPLGRHLSFTSASSTGREWVEPVLAVHMSGTVQVSHPPASRSAGGARAVANLGR